jgi:vanillate O-demethylase monooxygenase subunit
MFIKNVWYIAGHSEELASGSVLGRTIAGERIVFCRKDDDGVYALEDRCPHRRAPLSMGEMISGAFLRCPYHGITFDSAGKCVSVPGQERFPGEWQIRAYPVLERDRYLWVWVGDPARCKDEISIPDFLKFGEPPYESRSGLLEVAGDYRLLVDNLLDPTHTEFVHPTSFGSSDFRASREAGATPHQRTAAFEVDMRDDGIGFVFELKDVRGGPCLGKAYAMRAGKEIHDGTIDIRLDVSWQPPGLFLYSAAIKPAGTRDEQALRLINLHLVTPETAYTTHYFYRCSVLNTNGNPGIMDFWEDVTLTALNEDKRIIEAQQQVIGEHDLFEERLWSIQGDQMSIRGRRILEAMVAAESGTQSSLLATGLRS